MNTTESTPTTPNPIIRTTALRAYAGWNVLEYADGTFAAAQVNGTALSPVERSFADALYFVKHDAPAPR